MAGIARENVSRILKEWMDRKLVSRLAGYYCLENRAAIEREDRSRRRSVTERQWPGTAVCACPTRHQTGSLPSRWLPGCYRSNAISFPNECPGTRDHHLAFSEAIPNLCLSSGEQANGDTSRFNPIIANRPERRCAAGPVQNS